MKKVYAFFVMALAACACSDSDETKGDRLFFTIDEVQRPFYAYAETTVNGDGEAVVSVFADKEPEVLLFDVLSAETGEGLVQDISYTPDAATDEVFYLDNSFFSDILINDDTRLKGNFTGNFKNADGVEKYIECTFDLKKDLEN